MQRKASERDRLRNPKALLIDLDGVLWVGDRAIDGAAEAIRLLKEGGFPIRFVTNTTTRSRSALHKRAQTLGLPILVDEIVNAPRAAATYLRSLGKLRCRLVVSPAVLEEFEGLEVDETSPDVIVVGDIGDRWDYKLMSDIFLAMVEGAGLVALHKGRYYQGSEGLILDIGAFITGLEYATGRTATMIGKPSAAFFRAAVADMGVESRDALMIGDDIESDVGGAQEAGLGGILVKTGKYRPHLASESEIRPDAVVRSISDVPRLLGV